MSRANLERKLNTLVNTEDLVDRSISIDKLTGVLSDIIKFYIQNNSISITSKSSDSRVRKHNNLIYNEDLENGSISEDKLSLSLLQAIEDVEGVLNITNNIPITITSKPRKNNAQVDISDLRNGSISLEKLSKSLYDRTSVIATQTPMTLEASDTSIIAGDQVSITPTFFNVTGDISITGSPLPNPLLIVSNTPIELTITSAGTYTYTLRILETDGTVRTSTPVAITATASATDSAPAPAPAQAPDTGGWYGTIVFQLESQLPSGTQALVQFNISSGVSTSSNSIIASNQTLTNSQIGTVAELRYTVAPGERLPDTFHGFYIYVLSWSQNLTLVTPIVNGVLTPITPLDYFRVSPGTIQNDIIIKWIINPLI